VTYVDYTPRTDYIVRDALPSVQSKTYANENLNMSNVFYQDIVLVCIIKHRTYKNSQLVYAVFDK